MDCDYVVKPIHDDRRISRLSRVVKMGNILVYNILMWLYRADKR